MENFVSTVPAGWEINNTSLLKKDTAQGNVHSGEYSVKLLDGAMFTQCVNITGGLYYTLSFFAKGNGAQVELKAMVIFTNGQGDDTEAMRIRVRGLDMPNGNRDFGYYRGITLQAPEDAVCARIVFHVSTAGEQTLNLDDVSFSVN